MTIDLPPELDLAWYRTMRPHIPLTDKWLKIEFEKIGKKTGVPGSPFCYRGNVVDVFGKMKLSVLEIGPGHAPDFIGENVKYLDIVPQKELQELYPELPNRNGGAPKIDYLLEDLAEGRICEKFDLVYSAHNFEHQSNPIMHINSISEILNPQGLFIAVIPDRNYTFDYYRPNSTLIDILDASKSQTEHTLRSTLQYRTTTHNDGVRHWLGDHGESELNDSWVIEKYKSYDQKTEKFDSQHVMTFDCDSFKKIFGLLSENEIIHLKLMRVYNTPFLKNEFVAIFKKME